MLQRIKPNRILKMIKCKMRITHRHFNIGMAEYPLQYQNVAAVHHKMAGECVPENVGKLAVW